MCVTEHSKKLFKKLATLFTHLHQPTNSGGNSCSLLLFLRLAEFFLLSFDVSYTQCIINSG